MVEERAEDEELSTEEILTMSACRKSDNLSFFAFWRTEAVAELFGRLQKPDQAPSKTSLRLFTFTACVRQSKRALF